MEAIPIAVFWCLAVWALFQRHHTLLYLFFGTLPFGSFAVIPTELTSGLTLTPTPIVAILLIARQLSGGRGLVRALNAATEPSALTLLFLFWIVAGVTTFFMPRFFAGQVEVIGVSIPEPTMLRPTLQNVSQFVYISISVLAVFAFSDLLRARSFRRHAMQALCLGATLTVITGLLDYVSRFVPLESLLELFRTASYALLVNDEILDSKRVVGLMPEASSFGTLALSFLALLYFFRRAMPRGALRDVIVPALMGLLLALIGLSTSSAAYLGLCAFGLAAGLQWCVRLAASRRDPRLREGLAAELGWSIVAGWLLLMLYVVRPGLFAPIQQMFDTMVLQKTSSSSYEERTMWTQVSWNALRETYGLGVGLGGTRASNFAVALASNAGALGAALYFLFVVVCLFGQRIARADVEGRVLRSAVRWAYLPSFLAGLTIGTTPDFGVLNAFLYGFCIALTRSGARTGPGAAFAAQAADRSAAPRGMSLRGTHLG